MFNNIYRGKRVLVSGNTGFKGSLLAWWLTGLEARVRGMSLPEKSPCLFSLLTPAPPTDYVNILDPEALRKVFEGFQPEIVFHLAAQALVPEGVKNPAMTFHTNLSGTVNILECCRVTSSVMACVIVTSDKCYRPASSPLSEDSPLGGLDPYSASKSCAELAAASYRQTFFNSPGSPLIATARAGNVIGGGDWASNRLIPDLVRSATSGVPAQLRCPQAIRPWQHVFEPLSGYLRLGEKLLAGERSAAAAWNFAPDGAELTVLELATRAQTLWSKVAFEASPTDAFAENPVLRLSAAKAKRDLNWSPTWDAETALKHTILWYKTFYETGAANTPSDFQQYLAAAAAKGATWAT